MKNNLFRESSIKQISSPEQLNEYIKVSNPSVWVILLAAIILLLAVLGWSVLGAIDTGIMAKGISKNSEIVCYLTDVSDISSETKVKIGNAYGTISAISTTTSSKSELIQKYQAQDDIEPAVFPDGSSYEVKITAEEVDDGIVPVLIVTDTIKPISFLLN